jgi:hypothetical protein
MLLSNDLFNLVSKQFLIFSYINFRIFLNITLFIFMPIYLKKNVCKKKKKFLQ